MPPRAFMTTNLFAAFLSFSTEIYGRPFVRVDCQEHSAGGRIGPVAG